MMDFDRSTYVQIDVCGMYTLNDVSHTEQNVSVLDLSYINHRYKFNNLTLDLEN